MFKKFFHLIILILAIAIVGLVWFMFNHSSPAAEAQSGCTHYISPTGNDSNSGTSLNQPWRTIDQANQTLRPGETVCMRAGTYNNVKDTINPSRSGTDGKPITYKAYPGETPIIDRSLVLTNWQHHSGNVYWTSYSGSPVGLWEDTFEIADYYCGSWLIFSGISGVNEAGKYHQDASAKRFYVWLKNGDNPNNHTMRTAMGRGATLNQNYIVIDGIHMKWVQVGVKLENSNNNTLKNLNIEYAYGGVSAKAGSHHNKILNNTIFHIGSWYWDEGDGIHMEGHHTLMDGNDISLTGHACISTRGLKSTGSTPHHNIIQNNNTHECGSSALNSNWSGYREVWRNNIASSSTGAGIQTDGNHLAWYNNVFYENGASGGVYASDGRVEGNNKFFNNTFYNNNSLYLNQPQQVRDYDEWTIAESKSPGINDNNIFKNNIIFNNAPNSYKNYSVWFDQLLKNNILEYNNFFGRNQEKVRVTSIGTHPITWWESNYPSNFNNNLQTDPDFVDLGNNDVNLQSSSSIIDAGAFLTTITSSSGSGTQFTVADAGYFCDGFGIIEGDLIQLEGQTQTARITKVDYNNNTITIDRSLSWNSGDGVSLPYSGSAPDIGAYEYNSTATPTCSKLGGKCYVNDCEYYNDCVDITLPNNQPVSCPSNQFCCFGSCTPPSQPSITLTKSSNLSSASPNQEITYTIHYHNSSQFPAQSVVIQDLIPSGTTYVQGSADPTGGQYLTNPAQVEWQFNSLASGQQGDVEFRVKVD